jgi:D-alanine-D-alanine ligase
MIAVRSSQYASLPFAELLCELPTANRELVQTGRGFAQSRPVKTIVLFGGRSDERHVSVASAQTVVNALGSPLCWFWAPNGAVHNVAVDDLLRHQRPFEIDFNPARPALFPDLEQALDRLVVEDPVFVLAVHGTEGEDGTVQRMMEERGIPFTGSGAESSAAAFDKDRTKTLVRDRVRLAESRIARNTDEIAATVGDMLARHEKIVLKPVAGGSSRGLFFLDRGQRFDATIDVPYLVEQFIAGRELSVGVVDFGEGPVALPVIEIEVAAGHSFDYAGKYLGKGTREICPARIPDRIRDETQQSALAAHEALGCEGYSRTDVIVAQDGVYFLELNTLPGLTSSSLLPQELRAAGIEFREFLEKQIELARQRAAAAIRI